MENQTFLNLYYLYIQTSGILIALVSVVALYRIDQIKNYLIGYGDLVSSKINDYRNKGFKLSNAHEERLQGAVNVKSVDGIQEILIRLTAEDFRIHQEKKKEPGKTGFSKNAFPRWIETVNLINCIKKLYLISIAGLIITILLSFVAIAFNKYLSNGWDFGFLIIISVVFILNIYVIYRIICKSFITKIRYDEDKIKKNKKLKEKYPEVGELFKKNANKKCILY